MPVTSPLRRLSVALALCLSATASVQSPATAQPQDPRPTEVEVLTADAGELRQDVASLEAALVDQRLRLAEAEATASAAVGARDEARAGERAARRALASARRDAGRMAAALYVQGTRQLNLILSSETISEAMRKKKIADVAAAAQAEVVAELTRTSAATAEAASAAERALAEAEQARAEVASQEAAITGQLEERRLLLEAVSTRLEHKLGEAEALRTLDPAIGADLLADESPLLALPGIPSSGSARPVRTVVAPATTVVRGIRVASEIAAPFGAMLDAAARDGVVLGGGGYRNPAVQVALRVQNCGPTDYDVYEKPASECSPPTARPGTSLHERGLAIDFTFEGSAINSVTSAGFLWLQANAAGYGFFNLPGEPWHWSTNGN